jgi:tRNA A-37 threonylcarbamoyl transferase component Bud32/tetratricopeptide (TPR) repeat protein
MIGAGGMGKVYEADDPQLGRRVAIKLHKETTASPEQHERMRREARVLAQLVHDNVVRVYELAEHEQRVYLVMELVEGQALDELQQAGSLPWRRAVELYVMAGRGLQAAHEQEIVHRDFKPQNVIVDRNGRCKVLDFGVARELSTNGVEETADAHLEERGAIERVPEPALTHSRQVLGTWPYMAPEVHSGQPATPQSDQFSFCVALYEAMYGRRPYSGVTPAALLVAKLDGPPTPRDGPKVPAWLLALLRRGLSVDPRDRYPAMADLLADLERNRTGRQRWLVPALAFSAGAAMVLAASLDLATVSSDPQLESRRVRVLACLDEAEGVQDRWMAIRPDLRDDDDLDDLRILGDEMVGGLAEHIGSSCLEPHPRFEGCWEQTDRDFEALLARVEEQAPLPFTSFSGLAHEFSLCLEDEPSRTCTTPEDDGGSAEALSEAKSQLAIGRPAAAEPLAERALALAQAKDDRLGEIRAKLVIAEIYDQTERVDEARKILDQTIAMAMGCDSVVPAIDAVLERVEVELHHRARGRADLIALPLALARELLAGQKREGLNIRRALFEEKEAGVLFVLDRKCKDALELYRSALMRREDTLQARQQQGWSTAPLLGPLADAELNLGNALLVCGSEGPATVIGLFESARRHADEAVEGHEHPDLATFEFGLGRALSTYGRHAEAEQHYRAALESYARFGVAGEAGANVADVHLALAQTLRRLGRLDEAQQQAVANLEIRRGNAKARSPLVMAEALGAVGALAAEREDYEDAQRYHQEAIDGFLDAWRSRTLEARERRVLAYAYGNSALALCGSDRKTEAGNAFEEGLRWQLEPSQLAGIGEVLRQHACLR